MKSKVKVNVSKGQLSIIIAVVLIFIVLLSGGITCVVKDETPKELLNSMFQSNKKGIVGKWLIEDNEELFAYEFNEDGTYKSYIAGFPYNGKYEVSGNKLKLSNPKTSKEVVYKVKVNDNQLVLTKKEEDGKKAESHTTSYKRVDHINTKTFPELLNDLKNNKK